MGRIHKLNAKDYLGLSDGSVNYFEITGREATQNATSESFSDWGEKPLNLGEFKVIPFGDNNDIPNQIQEAILPNSLAPRLQNRKIELLFEQGPYLYRHTTDGTKYFRKPLEDAKIQEWLNQIRHEEFLIHNATQYYYLNKVFTKVLRERGARISSTGSIATLEKVDGFECRFAYHSDDLRKRATHVIVGDWKKADRSLFKVYPIYDPDNPTKYPVSIHIARFGTFGMHDYTLPDIYGPLEWIRRSTSIPKIFKALTDNSLNIKWHIQSPSKYWEDKRKQIKENLKAVSPPVEYKEQMLEDLKKEILDKLSELLSGVENVGKFWHNEYVIEMIGANAMEHGWKITPIEQKIEEYVKAQIEISNKADFATVAGLGLHAALGNVGADGKSDSGSEQLYALKIHQITSVNIAEFFVCKAINDAIRVKFNSDIKIGFYHLNPEREMDITNSKRVTNQISQQTGA